MILFALFPWFSVQHWCRHFKFSLCFLFYLGSVPVLVFKAEKSEENYLKSSPVWVISYRYLPNKFRRGLLRWPGPAQDHCLFPEISMASAFTHKYGVVVSWCSRTGGRWADAPVHKVLSLHVLFQHAFVRKYDMNTPAVLLSKSVSLFAQEERAAYWQELFETNVSRRFLVA